jgi:hypothetical protein
MPVLAGVDAASTYCYLLVMASNAVSQSIVACSFASSRPERAAMQIVGNTRDGAATRRRVVATRAEDLKAPARTMPCCAPARGSETALLISSLQAGTLDAATIARIGAPMTFGRPWEQTGCAAVIEHLAAACGPATRRRYARSLRSPMCSI